MHACILLCLLALLPTCAAISCYSCNGVTTTACNDPFNSAGTNVATSIGNTVCQKTGASGVITRSGQTSCTTTPWVYGSGQSCCSTDFCNGARMINQTPILLIVNVVLILVTLRWI